MFKFLVFGFDEPSKEIAVGFVGMWIPRSGIQAIVGSVGKSQDFSMLSTRASFPQSLFCERHDVKPQGAMEGWKPALAVYPASLASC